MRTSSSPAVFRIRRHGFCRLTNRAPFAFAADDKRVAVDPRKFAQDLKSRSVQVDHLLPGLAVRQPQ